MIKIFAHLKILINGYKPLIANNRNTQTSKGLNLPAGIYLLKGDNRNPRTRCEIRLKLTTETLERRRWHHSVVFIVNFEHISDFVLVFLLLTLNDSSYSIPPK